MVYDDLLIVDIGRSFLFTSHLEFTKKIGYKSIHNSFARILSSDYNPNYLNKFIPKGIHPHSQVICLTGEKNLPFDTNLTTIKRSVSSWKSNIKKIEEAFDMKGLVYINITKDEISFSTSKKTSILDMGILSTDSFSEYSRAFAKIGITIEDIINFFNGQSPIPQQVSDYHKSFFLSYIIGQIISNNFNLSKASYVIITSEFIKSSFLDRSGIIAGIQKYYKDLDYFSFDKDSVWELIINGGLDEFPHLKYLNKEVFYPEFTVISEELDEKLKIFTEDETKEVHILPEKQAFIEANGISTILDYKLEFFNNLLVNNLDIKKLIKIDYFKNWFTFYKYFPFEHKEIEWKERFSHEIEIGVDLSKQFLMPNKVKRVYYDILKFSGDIERSDIQVVPGERIKKGRVLLRRERFAGMLISRLISDYVGVVEEIDTVNGWIIIRPDDELNAMEDFDSEIVEKKSANLLKLKIFGYREGAVFTFGKNVLSTIARFNGKDESTRSKAIWIENIDDVGVLMKYFEFIQPTAIILPYCDFETFKILYGESGRNLKIFTLIILNGFGNRDYTKKQYDFFDKNQGKKIFIDTSRSALFVLEKKGKFEAHNAPYFSRNSLRIYTFDDWNLNGEVIYNDKDSDVIRTEDKYILDIARYNLIRFNNE